MARALPYKNGDVFSIPLRDEKGYAAGLIAGNDGRGIVVGYFFNRRFSVAPTLSDVSSFGVDEVLFYERFGDLQFLRGGWTVIGQYPIWDPEVWPPLAFGRRDVGGQCYEVVYSEVAAIERGQQEVSRARFDSIPRNGLSDAGAVELILDHRLP